MHVDSRRVCKCVGDFSNDALSEDPSCYCRPRWLKESILLYGQKSSVFPLQCLIGPHWQVVASTYLQIIGVTAIFIIFVTESLPYGFTIAALISLSILLLAYSLTAFSDPGIVFKDQCNGIPSRNESVGGANVENNLLVPLETQQLLECSQCNLIRPSTARHCNYCGVCVDKLDHHCPFTGKCIGKKNLMFFNAFVVLVYAHITFIIVVTIYYVVWLLIVPMGA